MTIIEKAKELIQSHGKDYAISYFADKITALGEPKNFSEICKLSGWSIAVKYMVESNISPNKYLIFSETMWLKLLPLYPTLTEEKIKNANKQTGLIDTVNGVDLYVQQLMK